MKLTANLIIYKENLSPEQQDVRIAIFTKLKVLQNEHKCVITDKGFKFIFDVLKSCIFRMYTHLLLTTLFKILLKGQSLEN